MEEERFSIQEIKNYIMSQDSLGDVAYNCTPDNIKKANERIKVEGDFVDSNDMS